MIIHFGELNDELIGLALAYIAKNLRDIDRRELECIQPTYESDFNEWLRVMAVYSPGDKWLCFDENETPYAVAGLAENHANVARAWMWGTDEVVKNARGLTARVKKEIDIFLESRGHRVECLTAGFHSNAHQWLVSSGLVKESELIGYGANKETFYFYSKVRSS